ncbi:MAG: 2TM domain-containing protein [Sphingobacteriales bacterium]|nr:MAG: 2TM domain-containing protein [Sphingobacteriales bacterium]
MARSLLSIRENSWLARIAARRLRSGNVAMVIGRTIHLHGVSATEFLASPSWVAHELEHIRQYKRYSTIGFLLRYGYYSFRNGYYQNPLEVAARVAEQNPLPENRYQFTVRSGKRFANEAPTAIFAPQSDFTVMSRPRKVPPTASQKRIFFIHLVIFIVATVAMFMIHAGQEKSAGTWVYPWHAWPVAAWALAVIGHWCALWTTYEDKGLDDFNRMVQNG